MIVGMKDIERVKKLEAESKLSRELIASLRKDLETLCDALKEQGVLDSVRDLEWKISYDIGRCNGHLNSFQ